MRKIIIFALMVTQVLQAGQSVRLARAVKVARELGRVMPQQPKNRDLPKNQPKQNSKNTVRDVQEQNLECVICGNDSDDVMYQTMCCGGKQFYCPACLNNYELSLLQGQNSRCPTCRQEPWSVRQFNVATGMYTQPVYQPKANLAVAKERTAQRLVRLHRNGQHNFNAAMNAIMIWLQQELPFISAEGQAQRLLAAQNRYNTNAAFRQFIDDMVVEYGSMDELIGIPMLYATLSKFFDQHYHGVY